MKKRRKMEQENKGLVMSLLGVTMFSMLFLFSVAYTNASWQGAERQLPISFNPSQMSPALDRTLNVIAENLTWSVQTAVAQAQQPVLSFLGVSGGDLVVPQVTFVAQNGSGSDNAGQVLGAFTVNPMYSQ